MSDMMSTTEMLARLRVDAAVEEFEGAQLGPIAVRELLRHIDALESNRWRLLCRIHSSRADALRRERDDLAARLAKVEQAEPVAWVPMHPRQGALWAMTTATPSEERLPSHYPLSPLYASSAPAAAPEQADNVAAEVEQWKRIAENAQAVTTGGDDKGDYFEVPSHLIAALALALDEGLGAQGQAGGEAANPAGGCGACGDSCRQRGSCRLADESPKPAAELRRGLEEMGVRLIERELSDPARKMPRIPCAPAAAPELAEPADPRTPPPGCRLLGDHEPAQAGDMAYIGAIGGRWRKVRPRMGIIGATMDELSDSARVLALARPCRCGPDGCPDSGACPKGGAA